MFRSSQSSGCGLLTPKPTTSLNKSFILAGAFHLLFKPPPLTFRINCKTSVTPKTTAPFILYPETELYSTYFLTDALGLSPEEEGKLEKQVRVQSAENAEAVIELFTSYGFTSEHMVSMFSAFPQLLNSSPAKTLKPKLECLVENNISGELLHRVLVSDPHILRISLHRRIAPCFHLLNSFFEDRKGVAELFSLRRGTWVLRNFTASTAPNVDTLLRNGVPKHCVARLFTVVPCLSRPNDQLEEAVREVRAMGFDPSSTRFVRAVRAFSAVNKERREAKLEVFHRFGWREDQIRSLMMAHPQYLSLSVEKLTDGLEFFMARHHWSAEDIIRHFQLLTLNLHKRISPRYSVLEALAQRGLVEKGVEKSGFVTAFQIPESTFLNKFVKRYKHDLPNLQQLYNRNMTS